MSDEETTTSTSNKPPRRRRDAIAFTIPASEFLPSTGYGLDDKGVEVAIVSITAEEEITAIKSADGDRSQVMAEMVKASLRVFNGKKLDVANLEQEEVWEKMGSKARNIVVEMFQRHWAASKEGVEKTKSSCRAITLEEFDQED